MVLVNRAMPIVEKQLSSSSKTLLLIYPGLLARYDQMPMLERLREKVGRKDGVAGVWMLIPGDTQAMLDGKAIPIISPGQRHAYQISGLETNTEPSAERRYPYDQSTSPTCRPSEVSSADRS